ncbi:MAG: hypothetical protein OXM57_05745 [bacterium]|nr:hypothetical protein [bacterium]MDE0352173.1 hypothetical protein [bacterium]
MSLPTNCSIVLVESVEIGRVDGTPTFEDRQTGPYRAWLRTMRPEEYEAEELAGGVDHFAKAYLKPGPEPVQGGRLRITVDGAEEAREWEVVSVRERLGPAGLDHFEIVTRRVVEGR